MKIDQNYNYTFLLRTFQKIISFSQHGTGLVRYREHVSEN
jgi:hypothetical protein